jgi:hypothetical protein
MNSRQISQQVAKNKKKVARDLNTRELAKYSVVIAKDPTSAHENRWAVVLKNRIQNGVHEVQLQFLCTNTSNNYQTRKTWKISNGRQCKEAAGLELWYPVSSVFVNGFTAKEY